ncbi:HvfC/BufC N-terminal domain-containing protein [Mesorhizobium dulcispinae]|uniref:HvfC/BufC N-terminal domain-containing protein n=1 Tax=Mesorhizobium dulcispinae TaxID=3072316 RepID=UPI002A249FC2|nr:DNA-binding domain-containing protein [Mesorhizobium sp. VK23D]MDX8517452.1 DNA-binding domain-containing protein [Mesorhizobium sp. VK23D]
MQGLAERQHDFAKALLDAARATPPGLVGPDGLPSPRRFAVYRNNVVTGLIETLKENYPAVHRIVGDEFFRAMAGQFAITHPPRSPIMLDYGAGFPEFIDGFEPAATVPYLADVARIERAWIEAYHAADAEPLSAADLLAIDQDRLAQVRLALHPSLRVMQSRFPALTIWRMNIAGGEPAYVDLDAGGEDALIIRPGAEVRVHQIPMGAAALVRSLGAGGPVVAAAIAALEVTIHFDLSATLAGLIESGAFTDWSLERDAEGDPS